MRYLYYTGCVIPYRAPNYDQSARAILAHLGVELVEMPDAGCCGIYVRQVDQAKSLTLAARIWSMAEEHSMDILTPCPGCASTLLHARDELLHNAVLRQTVNHALAAAGLEFNGTRDVKHLFRALEEDIGLEAIERAFVRPLSGKLASHYGCHLVRPAREIAYDDPEVPGIIDALIELTGAEAVDYPDKMGCCGMNVHGNQELRARMAGHKLIDIQAEGAASVVTGCPACYLAMGLNQRLAERSWEEEIKLPVLFLPQLLGLAFGLEPEALGISANRPKFELSLVGFSSNGSEAS